MDPRVGIDVGRELGAHGYDEKPWFLEAWREVEAFLEGFRPALVVLESGADCLGGDPLARLLLTPASLRHALARLCALADRYAGSRLLAFGAGYDKTNLTAGWCAVVESLLGISGSTSR
ncbi:hypothetical protein [Sorangium sp. So ce385]|uniref:hypothetical protein n=1 Tax=Sorangium sp. So ce385 TaxID=3133308 RepID=UPI003F5B7C83